MVPAWHVTIFAPYFVVGAVLSGVAAVMTLMILMRYMFKLHNYIWEEHIDAVTRLLIVVAFGWHFLFWLEIVFAFWAQEPAELAVWQLRLFTAPWSWLFLAFYAFSFVIPVSLWFFRGIRRNMAVMFVLSLLVNVGMWLERLIIIVPGLMHKGPMTFDYTSYRPSVVELTIVVGTFALVGFLLLMFSKFFPLIPIWEAKEGVILKEEIKVGNVNVPAIVKED